MELLDKILKFQKENEWVNRPFNFFNIIGVESHENRHSAFIANLLKPEGTHSCKNLFLLAFMKMIKNKYEETSDILEKLTDNVEVVPEKNLKVDNKTYGRVDIRIKNKKYYLLIENKIYADDQKEQILRYRNYLGKDEREGTHNRKGILLYLTLNGKKASSYSTREEVEYNKLNGYYTISYRKDIKKWLESCLEEDLPLRVKSIIEQYLDLIDFLNHEQMLKDLILYEKEDEVRTPEKIATALKDIERPEYKKRKEEIKPYLENMLEYRFWKDIEERLRAEKFEILDRKKYNYHKIEQRRKGKKDGNYGLIFKTKTDSKYNRRIYIYNNKYITGGWGNYDESGWSWGKYPAFRSVKLDKLIRSSIEIDNFLRELLKM